MALYQLSPIGVVRTTDGAQIPNDPRNRDWSDYTAWLKAGGVPDPQPVPVKVVDPVAAYLVALGDKTGTVAPDVLKDSAGVLTVAVKTI